MNSKIRALLFTLITALPVLAYLNSLGNTFVYDDYLTITNNHFIREWRYLPAFFSQKYFVISGELTYRPMVTLSYFMEYALWQLRPFGYHLTNIIIHTLNVYLVYGMVYRLFHNRTAAFLSSILFSIHPVFSEAVNAVSYREDLLSATFFLAAFLLFLKSNRGTGRRTFIICNVFSLIAYLFALLSKEMAITLPFVILACDLVLRRDISLNTQNTFGCVYSNGNPSFARERGSVPGHPLSTIPIERMETGRHKKSFRKIILSLATRYAGYLVISVFYLYLRFSLFQNPGESSEYPGKSILANGIMMTKTLGYYFRLLFVPVPLNADYVVPLTRSPADAAFIVSVILVILVVVLSVKLCRLSRIQTFSILWFFITLLPVMNIVPIINIMAERYLYLPGIGFTMLLGSILTQKRCISKRRLNISGKTINRRSFRTALITIICILFAGGTVGRNRIWHNEFTFSTETIRRSPGSFRVYNDLGYFYHYHGFTDAAIQAFRDSLRIRYGQPKAHCNLGAAYSLKGLDREAIEELKIATHLRPDYPEAHNNLGLLYKKKGMLDEAVGEYVEALKANPYYADAHCNLGSAFIDQGKLDEALSELEKAVKIRRDFALAQYNIAVVHYKKGRMDEAYNKLLEANRLNPKNADVHISLGVLYLNHFHDHKKALEHIREALRINPKHRQSEEMKKVIHKLTSAEGMP